MGSSKTANALMVRYNYFERGKNAVLLKPALENRDGDTIIRSRIGLEAECEMVEDFMDRKSFEDIDAIIIDEVHFLKKHEIEFFADIVDNHDIPVICHGLKADFQSHLFEWSKRLIELADAIEEVPTICWCGKKARFNARIVDGQIVRDGEQIQLGWNESYIPLCRKHFHEWKIST